MAGLKEILQVMFAWLLIFSPIFLAVIVASIQEKYFND